MLAITTFPSMAWHIYARQCLDRMISLWPGSIRVYYEGFPPDCPVAPVEFRPLDMPARDAFLSLDIPNPKKHFLYDAKRFCHKVFAQIDAADEGEPFWWIDADVAMIKPVPEEMLEQADFVTFLGRSSYTETGLIGFNPAHENFSGFLARYRSFYEDGTLMSLPHWTDCHAFDAARRGGGENLTPDGEGFENVMKRSRFGPYMAHFKGPLKRELYRLGAENAISAGF